MPTMTYADVKAALDKLTPEQLTQTACWMGDERGGKINSIFILEEDHVDFDGDGLEPVSTFKDVPDFDATAARYHCPKGTVFLATDEDDEP